MTGTRRPVTLWLDADEQSAVEQALARLRAQRSRRPASGVRRLCREAVLRWEERREERRRHERPR